MSNPQGFPSSPPPSGPEPSSLLDAYLDGLLEGDQLAQFEQALASDASLRAQVEAQEHIDRSLVNLFDRAEPIALRAVPSPASSPAEEAPASIPINQPPHRLARPVPRWMSVAAVLAVVVGGLWIGGVIHPFGDPDAQLVKADAVYKRYVETGFHPNWVCETDQQFLAVTEKASGEPFLVQSDSEITVVGWSYYEHVLSEDTAILLVKAKAEGKDREIIVVVDKKSKDQTLRMSSRSGLKDYSTTYGSATLHEISPLDHPVVINRVKPPSAARPAPPAAPQPELPPGVHDAG